MEIPDDKLYRIVFISPESKYHGEYKIYWNRYIAELHKHKVYKWRVDDIRELKFGDYVEADDGVCVPLLYIKTYTDKYNRTYYFCRFPVGTVYFYKSVKTFEYKYTKFFGNVTAYDSVKFTYNKTYKAVQKKRWVALVMAGMNPVTAIAHAFNKKYTKSSHKMALNLMTDKIVIRELKAQLEEFRSKLSLKFSDEDFIAELESLIKNSRKGTQAHRENIKFLLELTGRISQQPTYKRNIEEADYQELPPNEP